MRMVVLKSNIVARLQAGETANAFSFNWAAVRYQHTAAVRTKVPVMYSPPTANTTLSALRQVLKEAWKPGYMKCRGLSPGRMCIELELVSFTCRSRTGFWGDCRPYELLHIRRRICRDATVIALLYSGGLRRAEIVSLNVEDFSSDQNEGDSGLLMVKGKRNKQGLVYIV